MGRLAPHLESLILVEAGNTLFPGIKLFFFMGGKAFLLASISLPSMHSTLLRFGSTQ